MHACAYARYKGSLIYCPAVCCSKWETMDEEENEGRTFEWRTLGECSVIVRYR